MSARRWFPVVARWMAIGSVLLALLASAGWWWLLRTTAGLEFALHQASGLSGAHLAAAEAEGSLAGGFELRGLEFTVSGLGVSARSLAMRPRLMRLLQGRFEVESLRIEGARLSFAADRADTEPAPDWRPGRLEMPLDIVLRNIDLVGLTIDRGNEPPLVFSAAATGLALVGGRIEVEGLALRRDGLALTASAAVDSFDQWSGEVASTGTLSLPAIVHRGTLALHGNLEALELEAALSGGGDVRLDLALGTPLAVPTLYGQLAVADFHLGTVMEEPPIQRLDLSLALGYSDEHLALYGPVRIDGQDFKLVAGGVGVAAGRLRIGRLALSSETAGSIAVAGEWPLSANAGLGALLIDLDQTWLGDWRKPVDADPVRASGRLAYTGTAAEWWLAGGGELKRGETRGPFATDLAGTPEAITIRSGRLGLGDSTLAFDGRVELGEPLAIALNLALDDFDTTPYLSGWPGSIRGTASVQVRAADPVQWAIGALDLSGTLRDASFAVSGELEGTGEHPEGGDVSLAWGDSRAQLRLPARDRLEATLTAIELARLGPVGEDAWAGRIDGELALALDRDLFESLRAELELAGLAVAGQSLGRASLSKSDDYQITVEGRELEAGGLSLSRWRVDSSGARDALSLRLDADAGHLTVAAAVVGALADQGFAGALETLELRAAEGDPLTLEAPVGLSASAEAWRLGQACLRIAEGRACMAGEGAGALLRVALSAEALALASLRPLLPADAPQLDGTLSGGGEWRIDADGEASGGVRLNLVDGRLRGVVEGADEIAFTAQVEADAAAESIVLDVELPGHGRAQALLVGFDDRQVDLDLDFQDLGFVDGLSGEVHAVKGALAGRLSLPLADPRAGSGRLEASGIAFELPALGLVAREGSATVEIPGSGELTIEAGFGLAPGRIALTARLPFDGSGLEAHIRGENAGLVALPAVRLAGDVDFLLSQAEGVYAIEGGILLREGKIDLDRFAPTVPPSEDVVIEDAPPPPPPLPIRADVSIAMIQAVNLAGFGLEATLNGGVRVTQRPGRAPTARGEMIVKGLFESYGQKLEIERGRLGFSGAPDNPSLDLLAVKRVDRQRVGVQVRGNAKRPVARLYSDPALDQSETLSYLVLGRPLLSASGAEAEQLGEYAGALEAAGGSLLAGSVGKRLGLSAGVESFGAAVGSALVVGKYLTPRFFIGFGTSLVDSTQIAILRFRITENIDAEALSALEQRVSVNWRRER